MAFKTTFFSDKFRTIFVPIQESSYDVEDQLYPMEALETKMEEFRRDAEKHVEQIKHSLKVNIEKEEHLLGQKQKRLSENLIQDKEFDIYNEKQRLESLKKQTEKLKYQ